MERETGKRTVYLAGKITGDPYYRSKFYDAEKVMQDLGFIVVNPAMLPSDGFTYEQYMRMTSAMLDECGSICLLPDWKESNGAMYEHGRAAAKGKCIMFLDDLKRKVEDVKDAWRTGGGNNG